MADIKIAGRIKAGAADGISGYASEILFDDAASNKTVKEKIEEAASSPQTMIVTISPDGNDGYEADKTFAEIKAFIDNGGTVIAKDEEDGDSYYYLDNYIASEVVFTRNIWGSGGFSTRYYTIDNTNAVSFIDSVHHISSAADSSSTTNLANSAAVKALRDSMSEIKSISVNNTEQQVDQEGNVDIAVPDSLAELSDDTTHRTVTDAEKSTWNGKQNALTFDNVPTANSNNPVKSGGVYQAIQDIDVSSQISGKEDKSNKVTSFSSPTDTQYPSAKLVNDQLATKQGTISDLSTIRSGASAGATAYQKPGTGIPPTDLASAVQTSLGKADTAIQSVTVGTTTTGAAGTNASVTNTGTATEPVLSFTIPQGAQGIQGIQGPQGERGPQGNTGVQVDSVASIIHSIDPTATYAAADVAGADAVQDVLAEVTELGGEVSYVQDAVDELSQNVESINSEIYGYEAISFGSVISSYINSKGQWATSGSHFLIPVTIGKKYRLKTATNITYYAWLSGTETTGTPSYTGGLNKSVFVDVNKTINITPPSNTNYLYVINKIESTSYAASRLEESIDVGDNRITRIETSVNSMEQEVSEVKLSNINNTESGDNDLVISDENNNDIVRFFDGHIKTKNFNSKEVNIDSIPILKFIKNKYAGKRCAIIGDSISTYSGTMPSGYATHYPKGDVTSVNYMWWKIACDTLGMTPVNCAWSGSKVTGAPKGATAAAGCSDQRIADAARNGTPDIIIFFISCNDWGNDVPLGTWSVDDTIVDDSSYSESETISTLRPAYALMLKKARVAYPHCKLFCCSNLDEIRRDDVGQGVYPPINKPISSGGVSNYTWNQNLREIAEALGASFIDVHDCGINIFNLADYYSDDGDLHPNRAGQALIAEKVISALISK